jgi:protein-S-isoprenylcysteine O-methyltransferase Ste14
MADTHVPILAKIPPPAQFALAFLVGVGLDWLAPWRPAWMATSSAYWAGLALVIAGCSLAVAAAGRFVLRGTTLQPTGQPARLVVSGAHAWSRNPMYLSLTVITVGLALALGRASPLILVVLPWASINWAVIPFEEARLRETFGQDYVDYCRRVRRWV